MRKIEKDMLYAIMEGESRAMGNTLVTTDNDMTRVYLHGNEIARFTPDNKWSVTLAGWNTATTRSRLSAILRHFYPSYVRGVGTKQGQAFIAYQSHNRNIDDNEWVNV